MAITANEVFEAAATLLNDPNQVTFTDADQLPFLKVAWRELQTFLLSNGISDVDEYTTTKLDIAADTKE